MFWSQVNLLQMQPSPVNKWYNATQNWRKNKSTTLFADQIHTYDCTQYCIMSASRYESVPEQLVSVPEQLVSLPEQL